MRSVRVNEFGTPAKYSIAEIDLPLLEPEQVRIRVHAAGINPVDTYVAAGNYEFFVPDLPYTPGSDAAGVVVELGERVTGFGLGDRVFAAPLGSDSTGSYCELMTCSGASVHHLPDRLTFEQGAAIGVPFLTAVRALIQRGKAQAGETVLVHGASGGVGLPTVQLAVALGLNVVGTAGTASGMAAVKETGAQWALNHREDRYLDAVADITGGAGPDLVIEMLASKNLQADIDLVRHGTGRVVIVGSRGPAEVHPRSLMVREVDVLGTAILNMTPDEKAEAYLLIGELITAGAMTPIVDRVFPLDGVADAVNYVMSGSTRGKVVLDCVPTADLLPDPVSDSHPEPLAEATIPPSEI